MRRPALITTAAFWATAALLAAASACNGCQPTPPQPSPPGPPPPSPPSDYQVYEELVLAQCLKASDGGEQDIANQHRSDVQQPWLACLYAGGTIASCNVPCAK